MDLTSKVQALIADTGVATGQAVLLAHGSPGALATLELEHFYGFPAWAVAFWAIAVWGGVLGAVLLLLRKKLASGVFLVSFLSMVVTTIYSFGLSNGLEAMGDPFALVFSALIFVVSLLLYLYARAMNNRGVLS